MANATQAATQKNPANDAEVAAANVAAAARDTKTVVLEEDPPKVAAFLSRFATDAPQARAMRQMIADKAPAGDFAKKFGGKRADGSVYLRHLRAEYEKVIS